MYTNRGIFPSEMERLTKTLQKFGVSHEHFQSVCENPKHAQIVANAFKIHEKNTYSYALHILGEDFISPEEIMLSTNHFYRGNTLRHFVNTFPSLKAIEWIAKHQFRLIAGPSRPLNLLKVKQIDPSFFYKREKYWWCGNQRQRFSRKDTVESEWYVLSKKPLVHSMGKTWEEQKELLPEGSFVPNIAEFAWCNTVFRKVHRFCPLTNIHTRTSSLDSEGNHVTAGSQFTSLHIDSCWDDWSHPYLGLIAAYKKFFLF